MRRLVFIIVLFAIIAVSCGSKDGSCKHLSVRYLPVGGYHSMPRTLTELRKHYHKYVHAGYDQDLNVDLYSYDNDPRVFILFDKQGNIGGLRIGLVKKDLTLRAEKTGHTFLYDYSKQPLYSSGTYWNTDIWYTDVLFVSPETLRAGGRLKTKGVVAQDIFIKLEGKWTAISKDECAAEALGFYKQGCFFGMGMHYFYKLTPDTDCASINGVFLLFESGKLVGLGLFPWGSFTATKRTWFEDPPAAPIKIIIPKRPPCLLDWLEWYGINSIHIFFEKHPRRTSCLWPWQKSNRCQNQ